MTWKIKFKEDPLIQIIQIALELWVRSQCKSLSEIKVDIHGSTSDILSGNISRTKVEASNVNFKNISLEKVELISGPVNIKFNFFNNENRINIEESFWINGFISLGEEDLNGIIKSEDWNWISDALAENLLGTEHRLKKININHNSLGFHASNIHSEELRVEEYDIKASSGTLKFSSQKSPKFFLLPMDPSIKIEKVEIQNNKILISLNSEVNP